jgi:hypothetical protein
VSGERPTEQPFFAYLSKLLEHWYWLAGAMVGFVPFLVDYFTDYQTSAEHIIMALMAWFIGSFAWTNYQIFKVQHRELLVQHRELLEVRLRSPDLEVYFLHGNELVKSLPIEVGEIPEVSEAELENPEHSIQFRAYLRKKSKLQFEVIKARLKYIRIAVRNTGSVDVENIKLEFTLPDTIRTASLEFLDKYHNDPPEPPGMRNAPAGRRSLFPDSSENGLRFDYDSSTFIYEPNNLAPGATDRRLDAVPLVFHDPISDLSPSVQVTIYAKSLNPPIEQVLTFQIRFVDIDTTDTHE